MYVGHVNLKLGLVDLAWPQDLIHVALGNYISVITDISVYIRSSLCDSK